MAVTLPLAAGVDKAAQRVDFFVQWLPLVPKLPVAPAPELALLLQGAKRRVAVMTLSSVMWVSLRFNRRLGRPMATRQTYRANVSLWCDRVTNVSLRCDRVTNVSLWCDRVTMV